MERIEFSQLPPRRINTVDDRIVVNPSEKAYAMWGATGASYHRGMIALGLELETYARICEDVSGALVDELIKHTVANALRATLQSVGIADEVASCYESLLERQQATSYGGAVVEPRSASSHVARPPSSADALLQEDSDSSWGSPDEQLSLANEEWE